MWFRKQITICSDCLLASKTDNGDESDQEIKNPPTLNLLRITRTHDGASVLCSATPPTWGVLIGPLKSRLEVPVTKVTSPLLGHIKRKER